ncbi:MAG TPA: prolyl oligopeptidase family serine peptidase [Burkholderiaceae bacterium]|nr:prolyl oligopeptidase family serine peptidase [Burkholderiaceae bacterium]
MIPRCVRPALAAFLLSIHFGATPAQTPAMDDPYLWLEDVSGDRALDWVRGRNAVAEKEFSADPRYEPLRRGLLAIFDSKERIPLVERYGDDVYNFWRDAEQPRGVWRRTSLAGYRKPQPDWEILIDLDRIAADDGENWVWSGATCLRPERSGEPYRRCLIALSRGGADATVVREFDLETRRFVADGFNLPSEAKQDAAWKDIDAIWVATDFGPGSMTASGYPRIVKEWKRGEPLAAARTVYEGLTSDVGVGAYSELESGRRRDWVTREIDFYNRERFVEREGKWVRVDVPTDASVIAFQDWLLIRLRAPWTVGGTTWPTGALLAARFEAFMQGERSFDQLYTPTARSSLEEIRTTRSAVLITELDNVRPRLWELTRRDDAWHRQRVPLPDQGQLGDLATYWDSDSYLLTHQDFTTPTTLLERRIGDEDSVPLKSLPRFFDASGIVTRQYEAVSRDGTRIPYFVAMRGDLRFDGRNPTLLYGYGGFEITLLPRYSGGFGKGWLEPGGVLVMANLRGGGEFGPDWHRSAQRENKQRTWDDFVAVAEDLIARRITSPQHLGIMGGSQGGLLVTTAMVQRPELFGAVVAQVPLVDMLRYHTLLAGASWMAEYGDPDRPDDRATIERYSPYQNVRSDGRYPRLFLVTSTRDDRVHPGHARKMAARMLEQGHDVLYFENIEGGHGAAANNEQAARMWAQTYSFLWRQLR